MMVRLPCAKHSAHEFTAVDAARIVAALTLQLNDQERDPIEPDPEAPLECPRHVLEWSNDCEMYLEYTDSMMIGAGLLGVDGAS